MESSTPFRNSGEVFEWLSRFINLERGQSGKSFRLDRMEILAERAGHPERCAPLIHTAGSKGKGSVTGMIAAILEKAGYKTACYASPHVSDFRERIKEGSRFFGEPVYAQAGDELRAVTEDLIHSPKPEYRLFNPSLEGGEEPTFFELMTLWFFLCARLSGCRFMAVETGMGGRLDATNIVKPLVSVITPIELEHTVYLGNTLAAIAGEKAGIVKAGRPLVLSEQEDEALGVFQKKALETGSPLVYLPEEAELKNIAVTEERTAFTLNLRNSARPRALDLSVAIPGEIQAKNAGLAVLALRTALAVDDGAIREGLEGFSLPGRFERIRTDPVFIIDGAHTVRSAALCAETFTRLYGEGGVLLFGCAAGKDVASMAELLLPRFSRIIITTPGSFKKSSPPEILEAFSRKAGETIRPPELFYIPQTDKAIEKALELGEKTGLPILGTGSFYLAAEIRNTIKAGDGG
ncbi:MAG: tetrahydrofolate synthase [Treponema sp.]|nr:tetrahydrofolate synthase [Treponema sp.]